MTTNAEEVAEIRDIIVDSLVRCGGGHFGGALSVTDILWVLYKRILRLDRSAFDRHDRIILSKGHACIAQYAILAKLGYFDLEELERYAQFNSLLEGHPDMLKTPGIDFSSGSLGQGLSIGLGMAMGLAKARRDVWVIMGDGECQEGQVWEAVQLAERYKRGNLKAVVDYNKYQEYGWFFDPECNKEPVEKLGRKFESFGWKVWDVDGHDHLQLQDTFKMVAEYQEGPCVVLAHTIKGKGYALIERDPIRFHCGELSEEEQRGITAQKIPVKL
ncbi:transketolase [Fulvivirgaceae bacterium PWU4]|uniref:Transketolase n=1 Tax=Chryseosolibacter histidini TaxID=2782349 RepID=A0AAP2DFX6_9BACT|nr:transketolase [Chryseosolibacter histidini]MBT1695475.1 transketolase [Chryseosolibacter histidini]